MLSPEPALVPFDVSPLPAGPWLVLAPHADDETFGMGGALLRARDEGVEARVVVVTDGAQGGAAADLVRTRREEARRAAAMLGLAGLECWDEPDRGVADGPPLRARIAAAVRERAPAAVFFPGPFEFHPDHRATAFAAWSALAVLAGEGMRPQPVAYEIGAQSPANMLIDTTAQVPEKRRVMAAYASQNSENDYIELSLALDRTRAFTLLPRGVTHAEGFYRFSEAERALPLREVAHRIVDRYQ